MIDHIVAHIGKTYKCSICSKELKNASALRKHKRIHSEESYKFACHLCEKKFLDQCKLKHHLDTHAGRKSFICEQCGKGFLYNYMRDQHLMKNHGVKIEGRKIYKALLSKQDKEKMIKEENMTNSGESE